MEFYVKSRSDKCDMWWILFLGLLIHSLKKLQSAGLKVIFLTLKGIQRTIPHIYLHAKMASHKTAN